MKLCRTYTAAEVKMLKTERKVAEAQYEGLQLGHRFDSAVTKGGAFEGVPGLLRVAAGRRVKRLQQFLGTEIAESTENEFNPLDPDEPEPKENSRPAAIRNRRSVARQLAATKPVNRELTRIKTISVYSRKLAVCKKLRGCDSFTRVILYARFSDKLKTGAASRQPLSLTG